MSKLENDARIAVAVLSLVHCEHERFSTAIVIRKLHEDAPEKREELITCNDCGAVRFGEGWLPPEGIVRLKGLMP